MAVLLLIFMSNRFAQTLGDAAADALPRDAVLEVFGLQFLQYLALLAPVGVLIGILLALARLNRDSEMAALAACGVGPARLLRPLGLLSLIVAAGVGWLAFVEAPAASRAIEQIRFEAQEDIELGAITPGTFTAIGNAVIRANEVEGDRLLGVFIESETERGIAVATAEEADRILYEDKGELLLVLRNGGRKEGAPGERNWLVARFDEHGIPIPLERDDLEEAMESRPTRSLIQSTDPAARAELEWRVAAPVSILLLTLLAVPLGRSSPREGKYARVSLGLLIYMIYANLLSITRVWVERETVPVWLGTWWVHAALALIALAMLAQQSGMGAERRHGARVRHEPTG